MDKGFTIQKLTAFIARNEPNNEEGIVAYMSPNGQWLPLVGGYPQSIDLMRSKGVEISRKIGKRVYEVEFTHRIDLGLLKTHGP